LKRQKIVNCHALCRSHLMRFNFNAKINYYSLEFISTAEEEKKTRCDIIFKKLDC